MGHALRVHHAAFRRLGCTDKPASTSLATCLLLPRAVLAKTLRAKWVKGSSSARPLPQRRRRKRRAPCFQRSALSQMTFLRLAPNPQARQLGERVASRPHRRRKRRRACREHRRREQPPRPLRKGLFILSWARRRRGPHAVVLHTRTPGSSPKPLPNTQAPTSSGWFPSQHRAARQGQKGDCGAQRERRPRSAM